MSTPALLLSPYDALSHRLWREGLVAALDDFDWHLECLPPRHFAWRVRGNALSLAERVRKRVRRVPPALIVATSMLDLVTLRACVPALARTPALVYFHENQFDYPDRGGGDADVQLLSLKTALAADTIVFNSRYNRDGFIEGARRLLARMPDATPRGLADALAARSHVLPVPLPGDALAVRPRAEPQTGAPARALRLIWNHRWEHDKGPERLRLALRALAAAGLAFELELYGQAFRARPAAFDALLEEFAGAITHAGFVARRDDYLGRLARADVVLSTALHEFQGLAVLEAAAAGCVPLVPDRLAYPEFIPAACRYDSFLDEPEREAAALAARLRQLAAPGELARLRQGVDTAALGWDALAPRYRELLETLLLTRR
ncbi:MAG: tRNA-queuosine alpha-mannosyltransferase domain-containing protein [Gammaproteobacteria bacterium]